MYRDIIKYLAEWTDQTDRLPLLMRGARQVGKATVIEQFAKEYYSEIFKINFELQ